MGTRLAAARAVKRRADPTGMNDVLDSDLAGSALTSAHRCENTARKRARLALRTKERAGPRLPRPSRKRACWAARWLLGGSKNACYQWRTSPEVHRASDQPCRSRLRR